MFINTAVQLSYSMDPKLSFKYQFFLNKKSTEHLNCVKETLKKHTNTPLKYTQQIY